MSTPLSLLTIGLVEVALLLLTGLVVGRAPFRLALASVLAAGCLVVPFFVPTSALALRALLALASLFSVLRTIDFARDPRAHAAPLRMFAYVAPLDVFAIRRANPRFDAPGLGAASLYAALAAAGGAMIAHAPAGALHWPVAAVGGAIGLYAAMDAASALDRALLRAVGLESPPVQALPILSRSIGEFWGRRWNGAVGGWLRKHCFLPLARRRHASLGVLAAFVVSGAIHFWPVLVTAGLWPACAIWLFFLVQGALVALEGSLGVSRWAPLPARIWTVTAILGTTPLFTIPVLLACGLA